jgi:hypothetical protein
MSGRAKVLGGQNSSPVVEVELMCPSGVKADCLKFVDAPQRADHLLRTWSASWWLLTTMLALVLPIHPVHMMSFEVARNS